MTRSRQQVQHLIEQRAVSSENIEDALFVVKVWPDGSGWRRFIDLLLLWVGGLALAFSAMFFVAYNWGEMGRFAKFGLLEAGIVVATLVFWVLGDKTSGKVALMVAALLLGVLLAYCGQTYQTGADPWELFFYWGLLILPWALIGRFAALWILWALLGNLTLILYHQAFSGMASLAFSGEMGMFWQLFFFNTVVLAAWEISKTRWTWLGAPWALRLLAVGSGAPITWLVLHAIVDAAVSATWSGFVWAVWLAAMYLVYRRRRHDLFMLAGSCLSGIVVVSTGVGRLLLEDIGGDELASLMLLLLAMVVLGLGAAAAVWLKKVHQEVHP